MKKNKNFFLKKRESSENNYDNGESAIFEDDIFDDDFTLNRKITGDNFQTDSSSFSSSSSEEDFNDEPFNEYIRDDYDKQNDEDVELFKENKYRDRKVGNKNIHKRKMVSFSSPPVDAEPVVSVGLPSQSIMFAISTIMLMGMGLPVLLVFWFNAPPLDQHFLVLGVPYFRILFIFFITSAIMIYTSWFFLGGKQFTVIPVFLFTLFCCFPFIAGIRNDLTVIQAILELKIFFNWPFFLRPAYLFFQFLLPLGIVIYIFLQLRNLSGKERNSYAYICIALYLGIASVIGFSLLNRTNQPNIISYIAPHIISMGLFELDNTESSNLVLSNSVSVKSANSVIPEPPMAENRDLQLGTTEESVSTTPESVSMTSKSVSIPQSHIQPQELPVSKLSTYDSSDKSSDSANANSNADVVNSQLYLEQNLDALRVKSEHLLELVSKIESALETKYSEKSLDSAAKTPVIADDRSNGELEYVPDKTDNINNGEVTLEQVEKELQEISSRLELLRSVIARNQNREQDKINYKHSSLNNSERKVK
ncbi:MAG: acyltransferase [Desulfamplus sp.]|nr:acyltransferase [Desulfamplus sp.]